MEEVGVDLDGDWDPEKHDQQMAGLYERVEGKDEENEDSSEDEGKVESLSTSKFETDVNFYQGRKTDLGKRHRYQRHYT